MMSMYNMIFGTNPDNDALLALLGKTQNDERAWLDVR